MDTGRVLRFLDGIVLIALGIIIGEQSVSAQEEVLSSLQLVLGVREINGDADANLAMIESAAGMAVILHDSLLEDVNNNVQFIAIDSERRGPGKFCEGSRARFFIMAALTPNSGTLTRIRIVVTELNYLNGSTTGLRVGNAVSRGGGVGARIRPARTRLVSPEFINVPFHVCLRQIEDFRLSVEVRGVFSQ